MFKNQTAKVAVFLLKSRRVSSKSNMDAAKEKIKETNTAEIARSFINKLESFIKKGYSG